MAELLKEQEKVFGYNEAVTELVKIAKQKKEDLEHQCLLLSNQLKQLQESLIRERNDFDIWKRQEKNKFQDEMNLIRNSIVEKENRIDIGISNMESRSADIKTRQIQLLHVEEERKKINDERIEIERLRNSAADKLNELNSKSAQLSSTISNLSYREKEIEEKNKKVESINDSLNKRENELNKKKEEVDEKIKNLESLKEIVDPKIAEIDLKSKELEKVQKEVESQAKEVAKRIEEDRAMIRAIEDRDLKVKFRERELDTKEEELKRLALVKGITPKG